MAGVYGEAQPEHQIVLAEFLAQGGELPLFGHKRAQEPAFLLRSEPLSYVRAVEMTKGLDIRACKPEARWASMGQGDSSPSTHSGTIMFCASSHRIASGMPLCGGAAIFCGLGKAACDSRYITMLGSGSTQQRN